MAIVDTVLLFAILVFASAALMAIKQGFSQVISALQAIHDHLEKDRKS